MNLDKRENVQFVAGENLARHLKSPKFKRMEIYDSAFEVVKKKGRITDQIAIHIGLYFFGFQIFSFFLAFTILSSAKLQMLRFMRDMQKCLNFDGLKVLYMGKLKKTFFSLIIKKS